MHLNPINVSPVEQDNYIFKIVRGTGVDKNIKGSARDTKKAKAQSFNSEYKAIIIRAKERIKLQELTSSASTRQIKADSYF
jgi:hypothetical protein